jgi:transcriptional regulator GlxA family with amidase domain
VLTFPVWTVVDIATAAAMDALPQRLSVREMAAAAGVSLWSLQRVYAQTSRQTPVAHVQHVCLVAARRDLEQAAPGDTVFAIARRWGFTSPDGTFRDGYWAAYRERLSDRLERARAKAESSVRRRRSRRPPRIREEVAPPAPSSWVRHPAVTVLC